MTYYGLSPAYSAKKHCKLLRSRCQCNTLLQQPATQHFSSLARQVAEKLAVCNRAFNGWHTPPRIVPVKQILIRTAGERRKNIRELDDTEFKKIQAQYWSKLVEERKKIAMNRRKFQEMGEKDFETLRQEYPKFDIADILDLRLQFQTFDINQDGIIDFNELMQVLDDLGDNSDQKTREEYFQQIDADGSGAIDFEEFLGLIHKLRSETEEEFGQLGSLCRRGTDNIQKVRQLSVTEQMKTGLF